MQLSEAPEPARRQAGRFSDTLIALAPSWAAGGAPLLVALSGGADSSALLWLAAAAFPGRAHALTVDHQLRPEAAQEAEACAALCRRLGVPHRIARPDEPISGNVQSQAREARYALLSREAERLGGALIATAHHGDDQLETVLMRLARGSGVSGLAAIRTMNGEVARPLLGFAKSELVDVCRAVGIEWIEDPSNADMDYDRARMREALARTDLPIEPAALARSAKALADAEEALDFAARRFAAARLVHEKGGWRLDPSGLPHEIVRRLTLKLLEEAGERAPRGEALDRALVALGRGEKISLGGLVATGGTVWGFGPAPPRRTG